MERATGAARSPREVAKALYSVPTAYIGQRVKVRNGRDLVRIYHRGQLIKTHPRVGPGQRSTDPADYPRGARAGVPRSAGAPGQAREAGPAIGIYAERLLAVRSRGDACATSIACSAWCVATRRQPWSRRAAVRSRSTSST